MSGFIATPDMHDIRRLQDRVAELEKQVAELVRLVVHDPLCRCPQCPTKCFYPCVLPINHDGGCHA